MKDFKFSFEALKKIDKEIHKYPSDKKSSAVMSVLTIAQDENGWINESVIREVAYILSMKPIAVWEVATFYNMYNLKEPSKYKITICTNLPCMLMGSGVAVKKFQKELGIEFNQETKDRLILLKEGECMGACGDAPVCLVNDKRMVSFLNDKKIEELINELKNE